jgi:hypothetical protein
MNSSRPLVAFNFRMVATANGQSFMKLLTSPLTYAGWSIQQYNSWANGTAPKVFSGDTIMMIPVKGGVEKPLATIVLKNVPLNVTRGDEMVCLVDMTMIFAYDSAATRHGINIADNKNMSHLVIPRVCSTTRVQDALKAKNQRIREMNIAMNPGPGMYEEADPRFDRRRSYKPDSCKMDVALYQRCKKAGGCCKGTHCLACTIPPTAQSKSPNVRPVSTYQQASEDVWAALRRSLITATPTLAPSTSPTTASQLVATTAMLRSFLETRAHTIAKEYKASATVSPTDVPTAHPTTVATAHPTRYMYLPLVIPAAVIISESEKSSTAPTSTPNQRQAHHNKSHWTASGRSSSEEKGVHLPASIFKRFNAKATPKDPTSAPIPTPKPPTTVPTTTPTLCRMFDCDFRHYKVADDVAAKPRR